MRRIFSLPLASREPQSNGQYRRNRPADRAHPRAAATACGALVTSHDHVDVEQIRLDAAANQTRCLGGDEDRTGAKERVENYFATVIAWPLI